MHRAWIELIKKDGSHELYYGNGTKKIFSENVSCEMLAEAGKYPTIDDSRKRILEIGMHEVTKEHDQSWLGIYIEEWLRIYEQKDGTVKLKTVHICEVERNIENLSKDTDCDISNAMYKEPETDE